MVLVWINSFTSCTCCSVVRTQAFSLEINIHVNASIDLEMRKQWMIVFYTQFLEKQNQQVNRDVVNTKFRSLQQLVQFVHKETGILVNWIVLRSQEWNQDMALLLACFQVSGTQRQMKTSSEHHVSVTLTIICTCNQSIMSQHGILCVVMHSSMSWSRLALIICRRVHLFTWSFRCFLTSPCLCILLIDILRLSRSFI